MILWPMKHIQSPKFVKILFSNWLSFQTLLTNTIYNQLRFHIIFASSEEKVLKIMANIENSKASGVDKLSGRFLKDGGNILANPISAICNLLFSQGVFPNAWKVAKLKPIFIKGEEIDPYNYRPISLLPSISKIIEKVIHDQTNALSSDEDMLYNYQSGFRGNHSTNLCLSFLTNKVLKRFEKCLFANYNRL